MPFLTLFFGFLFVPLLKEIGYGKKLVPTSNLSNLEDLGVVAVPFLPGLRFRQALGPAVRAAALEVKQQAEQLSAFAEESAEMEPTSVIEQTRHPRLKKPYPKTNPLFSVQGRCPGVLQFATLWTHFPQTWPSGYSAQQDQPPL